MKRYEVIFTFGFRNRLKFKLNENDMNAIIWGIDTGDRKFVHLENHVINLNQVQTIEINKLEE